MFCNLFGNFCADLDDQDEKDYQNIRDAEVKLGCTPRTFEVERFSLESMKSPSSVLIIGRVQPSLVSKIKSHFGENCKDFVVENKDSRETFFSDLIRDRRQNVILSYMTNHVRPNIRTRIDYVFICNNSRHGSLYEQFGHQILGDKMAFETLLDLCVSKNRYVVIDQLTNRVFWYRLEDEN